MNTINLDIQKRSKLIKNIQEFFFKESSIEFKEVQAAKLLDFILNEVGSTMYDQIVFEIQCNLKQKTDEIFGIEKTHLN